MTALLLVPQGSNTDPTVPDPTPTTGSPSGRYEYQQDPDSGALIRVWVADTDNVAETVAQIERGVAEGRRFKLQARGFVDGGIRVAGTTERWSSRGDIDTVDFISIKFPASVVLTRRDRVTDIRNSKGVLLWKEEEFDNSATVFEVLGVTPITDMYGNLIEQSALLQRAEVQR
jgi:hypothetical protein